jgi:hypothetical protein
MADDKLAYFRSASILAISWDKVSSRRAAICRKLFQNASSRLTLVLRPAMTIECLTTEDFTAPSPRTQAPVYGRSFVKHL